jgi:hypothetical protein
MFRCIARLKLFGEGGLHSKVRPAWSWASYQVEIRRNWGRAPVAAGCARLIVTSHVVTSWSSCQCPGVQLIDFSIVPVQVTPQLGLDE